MNNASRQTTSNTTNASTPQHLYLVNQNNVLCIDAYRGKTIWQQPVPGQRLWHERVKRCCCQLQVLNQVVYVLLDFDIYALDARTGQEIWHASNPENRSSLAFPEHFSPLAFAVDHDFLYYATLNLDSFKAEPGPVTSDETTLRAFRITDGSLAWQTTTLHPQIDCAFTLRKATLYALLCRSNGASSRGREKREWQVYALDAHSGETRWHVSLDHFPTLRAEEGKVYVLSEGGILALDEQTGQEIWSWPAWGGVNWVALIDDMLFVDWHGRGSRRDQRAYALDNRTGQEIWIKKDCALNPLTSDGLFPAIRTKTTRLDLLTGEPLWKPPAPSHPRPNQSDIIWSDIIAGHWCFLEYQYIPQEDFTLLRYVVKVMELETGALLSEYILSPLHARNMRFLQQSNGLLYFSPDPGTASNVYPLSAFHLATGEPAWSLDIPIPSEPRAPGVHSTAVSAPVLAS